MHEDTNGLYTFYEKAVLPQFGIKNAPIIWNSSRVIGPDETVHYFSANKNQYALIFEDYQGRGSDAEFIKEYIAIRNPSFTFIEPKSHTNISPSYDGFRLPAPSQYCPNITGTFTLVQLADKSPLAS